MGSKKLSKNLRSRGWHGEMLWVLKNYQRTQELEAGMVRCCGFAKLPNSFGSRGWYSEMTSEVILVSL